ncbi:MAG TPA: translation elongation factor Ts [Gemmatimonadaceae bacterium]|nr:translation elongation factor Ts [Gemmatimonadaceae bacterium]
MTTTTFTAKDVQELRQRTGAGMMDSKNALVETNGNMEAAVELLRKKGIARADKRAGRQASEGRIVARVAPDGKTAAVVEVNSETDFVARNEDFGKLVEQIAEALMKDDSVNGVVASAEGTAFMNRPLGGSTVGEAVKAAVGKIGENIVLRRYARFTTKDGALGTYVHHNGKVAVLVEVGGATGDGATQLAKTVAEHVAAGVPTVPVAVTRDEVPQDLVDRERRIFTEQAADSGKPANIIEKMVGGRIDKFYKEVTLVDQPWVRDDSKTIADVVKGAGQGLTIRRFARFQMGQE